MRPAESEGVRLGARFSLATNRLRYCGPSDAEPHLYRSITEATDLEEAQDALSRFEALYPYLEAIARRHHLEPFDERVVEAYWIGNSLLDGFGPDDFRGILDGLVRRGLPGFVARELVGSLPANPLPHHAFHVAFVGVGAVTGHVTTTLATMEACRPGWGTVETIGPSRLTLRSPRLELRAEGLALGAEGSREVGYDPKMLPGLSPGDVVAVHWDGAALRLDDERRRNLAGYTARALSEANVALRAAGRLPGAATSPSPGSPR